MPFENGYKSQEMVNVSPANKLTKEDIYRWGYNAWLYLLPVLAVIGMEILTDLQRFIPDNSAYGAIITYVLLMVIDILRKYKERIVYKI